MTILVGDCRDVLPTLPERSVQTVITSPPYFGLRSYSDDPREMGKEPTPDEFVAALVQVFREVRRVLRDDGTVWLNLGDSYSGAPRGNAPGDWSSSGLHGTATSEKYRDRLARGTAGTADKSRLPGLKEKDLIGVPWMVAFALRADGWYLRSDVVWSKPNPMPESVTDRPTRSHEYLFLLSKGPRYFYDADAIREEGEEHPGRAGTFARNGDVSSHVIPGQAAAEHRADHTDRVAAGRNKRSVWTVATQPFSSERLGLGETEHFAVFPPKLIEPCVLAGSAARACGVCGAPWRRVTQTTANGQGIECPKDGPAWLERPTAGAIATSRLHGQYHDVERRTAGWEPSCAHDDDTGRSVVLDPFAGSGTAGVVCGWHGRDFIGIELSPANAELCEKRIALQGKPGGTMPMKRPKSQPAEQMGLL